MVSSMCRLWRATPETIYDRTLSISSRQRVASDGEAERGEILGAAIWQPGQDVNKVIVDVQVIEFRGLDWRIDECRLPPTTCVAAKG